ncbi:MAG: DNA topoisomerase [Bacteroidales bacterium]
MAQTMSVAQKLYEGGKITYMRTDSTNLQAGSVKNTRRSFPNTAKHSKTRQFKTRTVVPRRLTKPSDSAYPDKSEISGTLTEKKLYDLISKRTIAFADVGRTGREDDHSHRDE